MKIRRLRAAAMSIASIGILATLAIAANDAGLTFLPDRDPQFQAAVQADRDQARALTAVQGIDWCQTQRVWELRHPNQTLALAACPTQGTCDIPANRDAAIPDPGDQPITIRLKFNVFRNDDGSNAAATQAAVDAQVVQLNSDYASSRIQFVYETEFINSTQYRQFSDSEESGMKNAHADNPSAQVNIYVVNILAGYLGVGTFPWDGAALGNLGGIIVDDNWFGAGEKTLTHELGHNLGLWHTHHGVSEVIQCSACWERADGLDGNTTGDYCADTDPTPVNYNCSGPGGSDPCSGTIWGATDPQNYMGYAPDFCYSEFSPQQFGRMHCWINSNLASWLALGFSGTPLTGAEAVSVDFVYASPLTTYTWKWYFGDGDSAMTENPSHLYGPGVYDVTLLVTTDVGDLGATKQSYVTVWADTLVTPPLTALVSDTGYWEITGTNAVPLTEVVLPITITNVTSVLFFDSISFVGTRLDYFDTKQVVFDNRFAGQLAMRVQAGGQSALPPGTGPLARVHYRVRNTAVPGDTAYLTTGTLGAYVLETTTLTAEFQPVFHGATLTVVAPPCDCSAHGDVAEDNGELNSVDLASLIDHVFFAGDTPPADPLCPHINRGDFDCNGEVNAVDLSHLIDAVFFGGAPPCDPCACSPYPSACP